MPHFIPTPVQTQPVAAPIVLTPPVIAVGRGPEPSGLTREEIRRIVLDLIG